MQAIILAGGGGERLRPLTRTTPKPMLPVVNRPVLERLVEHLAYAGCDDILLTTFYLAPQISAWLEDYTPPVPVRIVQEPKPLGTAGCVAHAASLLQDTFLVAPGDVVAEVDFAALFASHFQNRADATLMAVRVEDTREFGVLETSQDGQIARFQEKPQPHEAFSNLANAGFYVLNKSVLQFVPTDAPFDFSRGLFPLLLQHRARFFAHEANGYWADIGTLSSYRAANMHLLDGRGILEPGAIAHPNTMLHPPFFIGRGCVLEAGAVVGPGTVLGPNCRLGVGAHVTESVLGTNVYVGAGAVVRESLLAESVRVGAHARVFGAALGARVSVEAKASVESGARLEVEEAASDDAPSDSEPRAASTSEAKTSLDATPINAPSALRLPSVSRRRGRAGVGLAAKAAH